MAILLKTFSLIRAVCTETDRTVCVSEGVEPILASCNINVPPLCPYITIVLRWCLVHELLHREFQTSKSQSLVSVMHDGQQQDRHSTCPVVVFLNHISDSAVKGIDSKGKESRLDSQSDTASVLVSSGAPASTLLICLVASSSNSSSSSTFSRATSFS